MSKVVKTIKNNGVIQIKQGTHNERLSKLVDNGLMKYSEFLEYDEGFLHESCEWCEGFESDYDPVGTFESLYNLGKIDENDDDF